jgi:uncharacterized Tic20 family protein
MSDHPPPPAGSAVAVPLNDAETRQWAGLAHLGGIFLIVPVLIIWLVFRARSAFVDQEGRAALNFQLTVLVAMLGFNVLIALLPFDALWTLAQVALWIVSIVFSIQGYQAVQRGQAYRYPFSLELIK